MKARTIVGVVTTALATTLPGGLAYSDTDHHDDGDRHAHLAVDPATVDCSSFESGNERQCLKVADEMYRLLQLIFAQAAAGDVLTAFQETTSSSLMLYPDATIAYGLGGFATYGAAIFGSHDYEFIGASATYRFKPLDHKTVIFVGVADFTIHDFEHGDVDRVVSFVQTEIFRRNPSLPRGWEQISEQLAYPSPLLGD